MKAMVIGAGRMGRRHIAILQELGLDVVAVSDESPEALDLAARECQLPVDRLFRDVAAALAITSPECVVVATTAPAHGRYVVLAAETGVRFILCEKPMATSLAECDRMIESCRRCGAMLAVNHQMRFMEQYARPKALLESDVFGQFTSVSVLGGNFGLAMNGTHYFEMFRFLSGEFPSEVTAWFSPEKVANPRGSQFEDRAGALRVTTRSGKRLYLDCGADQGHGMTVIYCGRNGQIVVNELTGNTTLFVREARHRNLPTTRYGMGAVSETMEIEPVSATEPSKAVLTALLSGNGYPTGEHGRLAVAVLVAAHVSDENAHRTVHLEDTALPRERVFPWA